MSWHYAAALGMALSVMRILFWNDSCILNYSRFKTETEGRSETHFFSGDERKSVTMLEGSQTLPACPSDRSGVKTKTLAW